MPTGDHSDPTPVMLGNWELDGVVLKPKPEELQALCVKLANPQGGEQLVTFHFLDSSPSDMPFQINRSLLQGIGGPLNSLVSAPFMEARDNVVKMPCESRASFEVVRNFLYCLPIDVTKLSPNIPIVADRWELRVLFEAYFLVVENMDLEIRELCAACLPAMATTQLPDRFKQYFTHRFTLGIGAVEEWLGDDMWKEQALLSLANRTATSDDCDGKAKQSIGKHLHHEEGREVEEGRVDSFHSALSDSQDDKSSQERHSYDTNALALASSDESRAPIAAESMTCQTAEAGGWSCGDALQYAKRNLWTAFLSQGMLRPIVSHLTTFSAQERTEKVLDVVLHQLDGKVSDEEAIRILRTINWENPDVAVLLHTTAANSWSTNAWRLLARAQTCELRRGCDTFSSLWTFHGLRGRLDSIQDGTPWYKHVEHREYTFELMMGEAPMEGRETLDEGETPPLGLAVGLIHGESLASNLLERWIELRCHFTATRCACGELSDLMDKVGQPVNENGLYVKSVRISSLVSASVNFVLMTKEESSAFIARHHPECGIVVKLLGRLDNCNPDASKDELGGQSSSCEFTSLMTELRSDADLNYDDEEC